MQLVLKFSENSFICRKKNTLREMDRKKYLIMVAGGNGTRMGGKLPKQFMEISGKAILHHALDKFVAAVPDLNIIVVLPDEWRQAWKDYCYRHSLIYRQVLVSGGITRFHSVKNALEKVPDGAVAAVHDGVRPLLSVDLIRRLFAMAETMPAIVPAVPVVDTLKVLVRSESAGNTRLYESVPGETADRSRLFGAQTPQIFWSEILKKAYTMPYSTSFTDDASVVDSLVEDGVKIIYPEGEKYNIKITTPDDLLIAEALLQK